MRAPSRSFFRPILRADGNVFMGQIGTTATDSNVRNFVLPRRMLRVAIEERMTQPGDIIVDGLHKYLLIDNDERSENRTRTFRLAAITKQVHWIQSTAVTDAVTGLKRESAAADRGMIDVCWEFDQTIRDAQGHQDNRIRVLSNQVLMLGDSLDNNVVRVVEHLQGITYAEVS